jgi:hypothetical protein
MVSYFLLVDFFEIHLFLKTGGRASISAVSDRDPRRPTPNDQQPDASAI